MIEEQLPQLVKARADYNIATRVVIDPMTPVIWATAEKLEQRELIGKLFYTLKELGVVLRSSPTPIPEEQTRGHAKTFEDAIKTADSMKAPPRMVERIRRMQKSWDYEYSPEEVLQILFSSYGLKRGS